MGRQSPLRPTSMLLLELARSWRELRQEQIWPGAKLFSTVDWKRIPTLPLALELIFLCE